MGRYSIRNKVCTSDYIPTNVLIKLYQAIIKQIATYASDIWGAELVHSKKIAVEKSQYKPNNNNKKTLCGLDFSENLIEILENSQIYLKSTLTEGVETLVS